MRDEDPDLNHRGGEVPGKGGSRESRLLRRAGRGGSAVQRRAVLLLPCIVLLWLAVLAGCGGTPPDQSAWRLTPGPTPSPRPGAQVWVVGLPELVLTSSDGGASWRVAHRGQITDSSLGDLWGVAFGDAAHGWAVERGSVDAPARVLATGDGGATWSWQYPPVHGRLLAVAARGPRHAWAAGYGRTGGLLLTTSDGGATWSEQTIPTWFWPWDVAFGDLRHGWVIGTDRDQSTSFVLSTSDGGKHWRVVHRARDVRLSGLACRGARRCWVVGSSAGAAAVQPGLILATSDGGAQWRAQPAVSREPLQGVSFPDALHGWAVGSAGTILSTKDGGVTWTQQQVDRHFDLAAVAFSDTTHGWALIGHLALLTTSDGGATWSVLTPAGTNDALTAVACFGPGGRR